jgi:hypothetical protein
VRNFSNYREFVIATACVVVFLIVFLIASAVSTPATIPASVIRDPSSGGSQRFLEEAGFDSSVAKDGQPSQTGNFFDGGCYCENAPAVKAISRSGMPVQPINSYSALGLTLLGLAMFWSIGWERATGRYSEVVNRLTDPDHPFLRQLHAGLVVSMGPGSMFFHATLKNWGAWIDVMSMCIWLAFVLVYNVTRLWNLDRYIARYFWFSTLYFGIVVLMGILNAAIADYRTLLFLLLGVVAVAFQVVVAFSSIDSGVAGKVWFIAGLVAFVTALVIWVLSGTGKALCNPSGFQGHAVWHMLSAAAIGCLYMYFRAERGRAGLGATGAAT